MLSGKVDRTVKLVDTIVSGVKPYARMVPQLLTNVEALVGEAETPKTTGVNAFGINIATPNRKRQTQS